MSTMKFGSLKGFDDYFLANGKETQILANSALAVPFENMWWKKYFVKATAPTPINADGIGVYTAKEFKMGDSGYLEPRSPFSPPAEGESKGFDYYTDSLGDFGFSKKTTAQQRLYMEKMLQQFNGDKEVVRMFIEEQFNLVRRAHKTITYLGAGLLSNGQVKFQSQTGFDFQAIAKVPTAARKNAIGKAWTDRTALIIADMQEEEKWLRDATGYEGALSWKMDRETFALIQNNEDAQKQVGSYVRIADGQLQTGSKYVSLETFNAWVSDFGSSISRIEIVEEVQSAGDNVINRAAIDGWVKGRAVLSPIGIQGTIEYAPVQELAVLSDASDRQIAYLEGGLFGIMNWVTGDRTPIYIQELLATFAPTLGVFNHMVIKNTLSV